MDTFCKLIVRSVVLLALVAGVYGCKREAALSYQPKEFTRSHENCAPGSQNCTYLRLRYPEFTAGQPEAAIQAINHGIRSFVLASPGEGPVLAQPQALGEAFFSDFKKFNQDFPNAPQQWNLERSVEILLLEPKLLSLAMQEEEFMGGAHPFSSAKYTSFNPATGKAYDLGDFFKPNFESSLTALGEKYFRKVRKLPPAQSLAEAGFNFEGDKFKLPPNSAAAPDGMIFYYNAYEIAAYVEGPTELVIPYAELQDWIRSDGPLRDWENWKKEK